MPIVYLKIPFEDTQARTVAKNAGSVWNKRLQLWEYDTDERKMRRSLSKYIIFNVDDTKTFKNSIATRKIKDIRTELSTREIYFLDAYNKHMGDSAKAAEEVGYKAVSGPALANRILSKPKAQEYLAIQHEKIASEIRWTYEEKMQMLKRIAELAVPKEAETIKDVAPTAAIQAISESNKMQGDYAAEKRVTVNVGVDPDIAYINQLMKQYERDY